MLRMSVAEILEMESDYKNLNVYEWALISIALFFTFIAFIGSILNSFSISFIYFPVIAIICVVVLSPLLLKYKNVQVPHFPHQFNSRLLVNGIVILSVLVFSAAIRLGMVVKIPTLLCFDPWKWMGIIREIFFTGTYSGSSLYPLGMAYFFASFWNGNNELLILTLRFFSPIIMIPFTTLTVYFIARRTIGNMNLSILSSLLFTSCYFYVWHTKMALPDLFSFFLVTVAFLLLTTKLARTFLGATLIGAIFGGAWLYHPLTAAPAIGAMILYIILVNGLQKISGKSKPSFNMKHTFILLFSFFLFSLPNIWQWILQYSQYHEWARSVYGPIIESENLTYILRTLFSFTSYFWVVYVLTFLGCVACLKERESVFLPTISYLLSLLLCIFLPPISILLGVSRVRFIEYLGLPISLLSMYAIKWISSFSGKLTLTFSFKKLGTVGMIEISRLLLIVVLISFPFQVQIAYRGYVETVPSAYNNSLQNAIDFVDKTFPPSSEIHILVEEDFYLPSYGQLSPRVINRTGVNNYVYSAYIIDLSNCDSLDGWTSNILTPTIDSNNYVHQDFSGIGSLKLRVESSGWFSISYAGGPWDWTNVKYLLFYYEIRNKTAINDFQIILHDSDNKNMYLKTEPAYLKESGWNLFCVSLDNPLQGMVNLDKINRINFAFHNPKGVPFSFWLDGIVLSDLPDYPEYSYQYYLGKFQGLMNEQNISLFIIPEKYRLKLNRLLLDSDIDFDYRVFGEEIAVVWLKEPN